MQLADMTGPTEYFATLPWLLEEMRYVASWRVRVIQKKLLSKLSIPLKYIFEYFSRTGCGFAFIYITEKDVSFIIKECCYRMHGSINNLGALERFLPSAGTLLQHNPFFERRKYITDDFKPREACCIKTNHCKWFYEVRPIPWCYMRSPFNPGICSIL